MEGLQNCRYYNNKTSLYWLWACKIKQKPYLVGVNVILFIVVSHQHINLVFMYRGDTPAPFIWLHQKLSVPQSPYDLSSPCQHLNNMKMVQARSITYNLKHVILCYSTWFYIYLHCNRTNLLHRYCNSPAFILHCH